MRRMFRRATFEAPVPTAGFWLSVIVWFVMLVGFVLTLSLWFYVPMVVSGILVLILALKGVDW